MSLRLFYKKSGKFGGLAISVKSKKHRLDQHLVALRYAEDLKKAQALVMAGQVIVNDQMIDKPATLISDDSRIRLKTSPYVSRGGEKLKGAIDELGLRDVFRGAVVLDIGASTGGFSDCSLQLGAEQVIAVDVGTNQLAWELRENPKVIVFEQTDIRKFDGAQFPDISVVVADISFNSLNNLLPHIKINTDKQIHYLLLVKPQFELPKELVPQGGVVKEERLLREAIDSIQPVLEKVGLQGGQFIKSMVKGRKGNQEIFYYVYK